MQEAEVNDTLNLVRKAQGGDKEALNALLDKFTPFVERIVAILLGSDSVPDAPDCVQECLIKAYSRLGQFGTDDGQKNFRAWLRAIARSVVIDEHKKWKRLKHGGGRVKVWSEYGSACLSSSFLPAAGGESPSAAILREEEAQQAAARRLQLDRALRELNDSQRGLILLRDFCELDFEEIAARLQVRNVESVRKAYYRARKALAKELA